MTDVKSMIRVRQALEKFVSKFSFPVRVQSVLGPDGPEVHVCVAREHLKQARLLLPVSRSGIPVVVKVVRKI